MKVKKEIIVLGDIEIGAGTLTDDFISDNALCKLILGLAKRKHAVDLVLNGDTFDFLKCPYIVNNTTTYPRHITPDISLRKLESMYEAHKDVFLAWKKFLAKKNHSLIFITGNHDYDLSFPQIQARIKELISNRGLIKFRNYYHKHHVYVEHGHQYDLLHKVNYNLMFLKYKGQMILNLPWISFGAVGKYMHIKEQFPFMERIFPRPALFSRNKNIAKYLTRYSLKYLFLSIFYYPLRYFFDPTYTFPRGGILTALFRKHRTSRWEADVLMDLFRKKRKSKLSDNKVFIFNHAHRFFIKQKKKYSQIQLDSWRDEYFITDSGYLEPKEKHYARIVVKEDGSLQWGVFEAPLKRTRFKFKSVAKDELKYLHLAAKQEGYPFKT